MTRWVLLVSDRDTSLSTGVITGLSFQGYAWHRCSIAAARVWLDDHRGVVELVLIGPGHHARDNTGAMCRAMRAGAPQAVLVVLTAGPEEIGVAAALDQGADDCLDPQLPDVELLARLRAHLRRGARPVAPDVSLRVGSLRIDPATRRVTVAGQDLALRPREFDLLVRLATDPGWTVRREVLLREVGDEPLTDSVRTDSVRTLDAHVAALRQRLATAAVTHPGVPHVVTVRELGYQLDPTDPCPPPPSP